MSNLFEPKSYEEIREVGKELKDFGNGHQPKRPIMAKDMTLRDYFAGQIISKISSEDDSLEVYSLKAFKAFALANEMMKERDSDE